MKKSIDESACLNSRRATKGHRTQLTIIGTAVPMKKARPLNTANAVGDEPPPCVCKPRDVTVKERQPTSPER